MFAYDEFSDQRAHDEALEMWRRVEASITADRLILSIEGCIPPGWEPEDVRRARGQNDRS